MKGVTGFLSHLICKRDTHLKKLFGQNRHWLPKTTFYCTTNLSSQISGAPIKQWHMRTQARRSLFEDLDRLSHGYNNICRTLANHCQLSLASLQTNPGALKSHASCSLDDEGTGSSSYYLLVNYTVELLKLVVKRRFNHYRSI